MGLGDKDGGVGLVRRKVIFTHTWSGTQEKAVSMQEDTSGLGTCVQNCVQVKEVYLFFIPSFADISEPLNTKLFFSTVGHIVDQLGAL